MKKILLFLLFTGSLAAKAQQSQPAAPLVITPQLVKTLTDSLAAALQNNYVYPDKAVLMTRFIQEQYRKGAYQNIRELNALAIRMTADLQTAWHDPHMAIHFDPELAAMGGPPRAHSPNAKEDSMRTLAFQQHNFMFSRAEVLQDNIGYLKLDGFADNIGVAKATVSASFQFLKYTRVLIIDIRQNHGGSPEMVKLVESYFFADRTRVNDIIIPGQHKNLEGWTDPAANGGLVLTMPVYILTSNTTFSAAEDFAYGMQAAKRAIIAGETTGGGAHPARTFYLGNGFIMDIPFARSYNVHTATDWEGTGVIPSIALKAGSSTVEVVALLFSKEQALVQSGRDNWQANQQKATDTPVDEPAVRPYLGTYAGGLKFYVQGGVFYCQNAERGNQVFKLRPIAAGLYQLDENVQVKFGVHQGQVSGIGMFWKNGDYTFKEKTM